VLVSVAKQLDQGGYPPDQVCSRRRHRCPTTHRTIQLGIQFFQISNDDESWKILQAFDDKLRKKYKLGRVSLAFDGFALADTNV
jgi:hypothetical protein